MCVIAPNTATGLDLRDCNLSLALVIASTSCSNALLMNTGGSCNNNLAGVCCRRARAS